MQNETPIHNRQSLRLKNYDYTSDGMYFVTICTNNNENMFWKKGENVVSPLQYNDIGFMVDKWWNKMFQKFNDEIKIDKYVIMPNHLHGIIKINKNSVGAIPWNRPNLKKYNDQTENQNIQNKYKGLGQYISWFKRMTTNEYIRGVKNLKWPPFNQKFWQRNFHDHIIRNETDLNRIRKYIIDNPSKWDNDQYKV